MSSGVFHAGIFAQAEDVDVYWRTVEPFANSNHERLLVALAEFCNNLRYAPWREVIRQTGNDPFLDIFTGPTAVPK
jgi:hypothetical protein